VGEKDRVIAVIGASPTIGKKGLTADERGFSRIGKGRIRAGSGGIFVQFPSKERSGTGAQMARSLGCARDFACGLTPSQRTLKAHARRTAQKEQIPRLRSGFRLRAHAFAKNAQAHARIPAQVVQFRQSGKARIQQH
jgi:hypothetical protein